MPVDLEVEEGGVVDCLGERCASRSQRPGVDRQGALEDLLREDLAQGNAPRWLVKAEPGAGKTTLLRQLAHRLATPDAPGRPLPMLVSLAAWERQGGDIFEHASHVAQPDEERPERLARALRAAGKGHGRLWLLLDGFDEVREHEAMRGRIAELARARDLRGAVLVVTSRATAIEGGRSWGDFTSASLRYLDEARRRLLVRRLLAQSEAAAASFWREVGEAPGVAVLLRNPFLLTLAVGLHAHSEERGAEPPRNRLQLLRRALDDCLARGGAPRQPDDELPDRWSPVGARLLLRALSLELHRGGGEAWPREELSRAILGLSGHYPAVAGVFGRRDGTIWASDRVFLDDLAAYGGVLGPLVGGQAALSPGEGVQRGLGQGDQGRIEGDGRRWPLAGQLPGQMARQRGLSGARLGCHQPAPGVLVRCTLCEVGLDQLAQRHGRAVARGDLPRPTADRLEGLLRQCQAGHIGVGLQLQLHGHLLQQSVAQIAHEGQQVAVLPLHIAAPGLERIRWRGRHAARRGVRTRALLPIAQLVQHLDQAVEARLSGQVLHVAGVPVGEELHRQARGLQVSRHQGADGGLVAVARHVLGGLGHHPGGTAGAGQELW